jgi:hypothetical protein
MEDLASPAINQARLSADELQQDHERMRLLLSRFSGVRPVGERRDAMRLALDLFEVHTALEEQLYVDDVHRATYGALSGMMEQLEMTEPSGRLYLARGLELRQALEAYLAREEAAGHCELGADAGDRQLLSLRHTLVREAQRLLRVN